MDEHLKKRGRIPEITQEVLKTFGKLQPKLEHFAPTPLPDKSSVIQVLNELLEVFYPGYFGRKYVETSNIEHHIGDLLDSIYSRLAQEIYRSVRPDCDRGDDPCSHCQEAAEEQGLRLLEKLPGLRQRLSFDVQAALDGDPAAKSVDEVIFAYPAIQAISIYRVAHELNVQGIPLLPRIMTEHAKSVTGIDIHPGATIGASFFIDHGTGVVIGETAIIGDRVKLYQGVSLGASSIKKDDEGRLVRGNKRHPTIEDDVVIYANATILGGNTVIGKGSIIGGSTFLVRSVPPNSIIRNEA